MTKIPSVEEVVEQLAQQEWLMIGDVPTAQHWLRKALTTYAKTVAEEAVRVERERKGWKGYAVVDAETDYYLYSDFFVNRKDAVKYWKNEMSETKGLVIIELDVCPTLTPLPDKE